MRLALVFGEKQGEVIKKRLEGIKDNLNIDVFDSLPRYIDLTYKKNIVYDRVLVISGMFKNKGMMNDLYQFWGNTSKDTQIVVLCRKGKDDNLASAFMNMFQSPVVAVMLLENTTVQLISEAVLLSPKVVNDRYGIKDYLSVETGDDEVVVPTGLLAQEGVEPQADPTPEPAPQPQPAQSAKTQQQKKGGFLSGLFGGKKHKGSVQPQSAPEPQSEQQFSETENFSENYDNNYSDECDNAYGQEVSNSYDNNTSVADYPTEEPQGYEQVDNFQSDNFSDNSENGQVFEQQSPTLDQSQADMNFGTTSEDDFDFGTQAGYSEPQVDEDFSEAQQSEANTGFVESAPQPQPTQMQYNPQPQPAPVVEDTDFGNQSTFVDEDFGTEEFDAYSGNNDFENDAVEVDEDFSTDTVDYSANMQQVRQTPNRNVTTVDDDFAGMNVASAEEAYRQQNEQPKVVTKTVVKEVVRDTGRGTINALKALYSGRTHKIIIVTGDRGTGITSTALNIAKQMSAKVPILYFDCDVDNHGLLSYINYDNFRDYENTHMQGVKLATNGKAFKNCVCRFDDNFDLLTTDYSCDVEDSEIEVAGTTVAEVSGDYGAVIVDCPLDKLHLISDLIMIGNTVLCVEGSKRGFMNMLCRLENSPLPMRYKRAIVSKGVMFITKCNSKTDMGKLRKYIGDIFMATGADWMSMESREFNGKLNDNILNQIIE